MSWDEVKKGRDVWPPDIEKTLMHYYRAEYLDPKYFIIFKDRARLYHVLGENKKSMEEYQKWYDLGSSWRDEVTKEMGLRKEELKNHTSFKKITPWEYLQKYMSGDKEVDPYTKGKKKKSNTIVDVEKQQRIHSINKIKKQKKITKKDFVVEKQKIIFQSHYNYNKEMEEEIINKFKDNEFFNEIFPKLKDNLKKLSDKKILELIENL